MKQQYICKLELKEGHVTKYAISLYYKLHWYQKTKSSCLHLFRNDEELNKFISEVDMDKLMRVIKEKICKEEYIVDKDIKLKIKDFNKQFKRIKVEV